jgi:Zn finger protein HypA/HybF involved in hydrogenase expression
MKKKYTEEQLIEAVRTSTTLQQALDKLNLIGGHTRIKEKITLLSLNTDHWENFSGTTPRKILSLDKLLKKGTFIQTSNLRARLLNNGIFEYKCVKCGINEWNGEAISLQLDHINGQRKDNRLENLRLLCPNCHSQTPTYCGRNSKGIRKKKEKYIRYPCAKCGKLLKRYQNKLKMCLSCRKVEYGGKLTNQQLKQFYLDYDSKQFTLTKLRDKYHISNSTIYNLLGRRGKR